MKNKLCRDSNLWNKINGIIIEPTVLWLLHDLAMWQLFMLLPSSTLLLIVVTVVVVDDDVVVYDRMVGDVGMIERWPEVEREWQFPGLGSSIVSSRLNFGGKNLLKNFEKIIFWKSFISCFFPKIQTEEILYNWNFKD